MSVTVSLFFAVAAPAFEVPVPVAVTAPLVVLLMVTIWGWRSSISAFDVPVVLVSLLPAGYKIVPLAKVTVPSPLFCRVPPSS